MRLLWGDLLDSDGMADTPRRVIDHWINITKGLEQDPIVPLVRTFECDHDEIVLVKNIAFNSLCIPGYGLVNAVGGARKARTIKEGDRLWTLNHGIPVQTTVTSVGSRIAESITILKLVNGTRIEVTPDHPIKTQYGWQEAGLLQVGEVVEYVNPRTLCKEQYSFNLNKDLGYVLGAVASDGSIQDARRICLEVSELWFAQKYQKALKGAFDIDVEIQPITKPSGFKSKDISQYRVRFVSSQIAKRLLKQLGLPSKLGSKSKTKIFKLPKVVLSDKSILDGFLEGYGDGDGTDIRFKNGTSQIFISSNQGFLEELGAIVGTHPHPVRGGCYGLYVGMFWDRAGWRDRHGFEQIEHTLDLGESEWVAIQSVETIHKPVKVYSFQCREYPTFLIRGVLSHNCEHHLLPFHGVAHVAYIPSSRVVGLSKIPRCLDILASRPQMQERLTHQLAQAISQALEAQGVAVVMEASHTCMTTRGVLKATCDTVTSAMTGVFRDEISARAEVMALIRSN